MQEASGLKTEIAGLSLHNPTILASGILGTSAETLREVALAGAGAVTTKSVGLKPRVGYANPTVIQVECGLLNAVGLPNPGIHKFAEEIKELNSLEIPVIVSVYGFSPKEYAEVASVAAESGADALELNLSCPHVKGAGAEIGQNPEMITDVVKEVKATVDKPVFAKLTPNVANIKELAEAAVSAGVDAVTAINTVRAMTIDIETYKPILANKIGGLSGGAVKPIAVRCVYEVYEAVEVPIIGCGGVRTWKDAVEFLLAGASAVQIGSAIAYEDLAVFKSVADGVAAYLEEKGYGSVKEIVGLAHED
ncbi:MAG: dihydroorotate dehydrogenase [Candidatus Bathyarchaeota archaeon]|nr:dihydroorotate dehydrogenase [Candidatus Bathyarchaeota archaeon]